MDGSITTLNVQLTRSGDLSQTSPPYAPPPGTRTVTGRVFVNQDGVRTPAAGAFVGFEFFDYVAASTITDAAGRFLLCGLPTTQLQLGASSTSTNGASVSIESGGDTTVDIEL